MSDISTAAGVVITVGFSNVTFSLSCSNSNPILKLQPMTAVLLAGCYSSDTSLINQADVMASI